MHKNSPVISRTAIRGAVAMCSTCHDLAVPTVCACGYPLPICSCLAHFHDLRIIIRDVKVVSADVEKAKNPQAL